MIFLKIEQILSFLTQNSWRMNRDSITRKHSNDAHMIFKWEYFSYCVWPISESSKWTSTGIRHSWIFFTSLCLSYPLRSLTQQFQGGSLCWRQTSKNQRGAQFLTKWEWFKGFRLCSPRPLKMSDGVSQHILPRNSCALATIYSSWCVVILPDALVTTGRASDPHRRCHFFLLLKGLLSKALFYPRWLL